jgi:hypothetical protein
MEVNMDRRKMLLLTGGAIVAGFAVLAGFADNNAIFAADDDAKGRTADQAFGRFEDQFAAGANGQRTAGPSDKCGAKSEGWTPRGVGCVA